MLVIQRLHDKQSSKQFQNWRILFAILCFIAFGFEANAQGWNIGIHDPSSIVKCGDKYWIFGTGTGIYTKYSTDMATWIDGTTPFTTANFPSWITKYAKTSTETFQGYFWAPDIIYMNNKYYLYYSCSIWGTMSSCIGVAVSENLESNVWVDAGDIGIYSNGTTTPNGDYVNAIDPAIMRGHDGRIWLTYGSFNRGGIMVTEIDSTTGKPTGTKTSIANSWTGGTAYGEGEGSCMTYHDGYYYLFYDKGGCCSGVNSTYYIVMGRCETPDGTFVDKDGKNMRVVDGYSGGTVFFKHDDTRGTDDRFYGPGHLAVYRENKTDYVTFHYYNPNGYWDYANNIMGYPALGIGKLKWGTDGWPTISFDFLDRGFYTFTNVNSDKAMDLQSQNLTDGTFLYQYTLNNSWDTQKWLLAPMSTGEYTIRNYADTTKYLEAAGTDNNEYIQLTSTYTGTVNQKFRLIQSPNGKILIYPSSKDKVIDVPNASKADVQVKLWGNSNNDCQKWIPTSFVETITTSQSDLSLNYQNTIYDVLLACNASWQLAIDDLSWLEVSPLSGKGDEILSIHATENSLDIDRTNKITIVSKSGTRKEISITQKTKSSTGISTTIEDGFEIFPNPSTGIISLKCKQPAILDIYNNTGNSILSYTISDSNIKIDCSNLESGIYLFKITQKDGGVKTKKVLKQ